MSFLRQMTTPLCAAGAVVLLGAALGLRPGLEALRVRYTKQPIEPRITLQAFDAGVLPTWGPARPDHGMTMDEEDPEALDWIWRPLERDRTGVGSPVAFGTLFITYYSDPRESIPHTPDVCYAQSGATINGLRTVSVPVEGLSGREAIDVQLLDVTRGGVRLAVAYVLCTNGEFYTLRHKARFAMGWPGDRHVYYAKIEAIVPCRGNIEFEEATEHATALLAESLPALLGRHFPDDRVVRDGRDDV